MPDKEWKAGGEAEHLFWERGEGCYESWAFESSWGHFWGARWGWWRYWRGVAGKDDGILSFCRKKIGELKELVAWEV